MQIEDRNFVAFVCRVLVYTQYIQAMTERTHTNSENIFAIFFSKIPTISKITLLESHVDCGLRFSLRIVPV